MESEALAGFRGRYPVTRDIPVAWGDMDALGHVNNTVYFRYFETARLALLEGIEFFPPTGAAPIGPILAATDCRFRAPLTYPDTVTAAAWIQTLADDGFTMGYAVFSHLLDRVAAEGTGRIVVYDYAAGKKAPLADTLRDRLAACRPGR